jgi:hypothetical protein
MLSAFRLFPVPWTLIQFEFLDLMRGQSCVNGYSVPDVSRQRSFLIFKCLNVPRKILGR